MPRPRAVSCRTRSLVRASFALGCVLLVHPPAGAQDAPPTAAAPPEAADAGAPELETTPPPPPLPPAVPPEVLATAARLRDEALAGTWAWDFVRDLTVEVGPRLAGSPGDAAAVEWARRRLTAWRLPAVGVERVPVPRWIRGEASGEMVLEHLQPSTRPVTLAALGGSPPTPAAGLEAEIVAVASVEELEATPAEAVRGRIVYLSTRMERTRDGSGYGTAVAIRGRGVAVAGAKGAVAVLIRSVSTAGHRLAHTGSARTREWGLPPVPCAALSPPDADLLEEHLAGRKPVRFRLRLGSHGGDDPEAAESANVWAEIPGREMPAEVVLLACHLDSWDLGTGAEDDAAGCSVVVEAARRIAELGRRPRRTVRVVLFANEEFGLSGARVYAANRPDAATTHVLAAEADLGSGRLWALQTHVLPAAEPVVEAIAALLRPLGIERDTEPARGGADLIPLVALGVPALDLQPDASAYFDVHHSASDTLDKVSRTNLDHAVAAYAAFAWVAAESDLVFGPVEPPPPPARR